MPWSVENTNPSGRATAEELSYSVDDVTATVENICSEFSYYDGALADIYYSALLTSQVRTHE